MASSFIPTNLIGSKPSLRGHFIVERQLSGSGFSVFSAIERSTHETRVVYLARHHTSSVVAIATMLRDSGIEFEAMRLRNGNICFVADAGQQEIDSNTIRTPMSRNVKFLKFWKWPMIFVGFGVGAVVLTVAVAGGVEIEPPRLVIPPSPEVIRCDEFLLASEKELRGFLEEGQKSTSVEFNVLSSMEIGGLRSIELVANCKMGSAGGEISNDSQRWRATLGKSENKWAVIKMIRLEN